MDGADFAALSDLSFEVGRGERFGVVGDNGAGKTTLLRVLAGIYRPDAGALEVGGRVSSLLQLGAGFSPELTGAENLSLNASLYGLGRREVEAIRPAITAFAEIGDWIGRPLRTYSAGMSMRLAFAIAIHLEHEILVVDEAFAVGDARFRRKALDRIRRLAASGATLVIASHGLPLLAALCDRILLLERGRAVAAGPPGEVLDRYRRANGEPEAPVVELF